MAAGRRGRPGPFPAIGAPDQTAMEHQSDPAAALMLALYQPDIPQNAGTMLRACACLGLDAAIIEPAGFPVSDRHFRRAGMDYLDHVRIDRHISFADFELWRARAAVSYTHLTLPTKRIV